MSTQYCASVVFGYPFRQRDLESRTRHPLWGVHRYDPETGSRVPEYLLKYVDIEDGLPINSRIKAHRTSGGEIQLVGMELSQFDIEVGTDLELATVGLPPGSNDPEFLAIVKCARRVCARAGLVYDPAQLRVYLVGFCS